MGQLVTLTGAGYGGVPPYSYQWTVAPAGTVPSGVISTNSTLYYTPTSAVEYTATLTVQDSSGQTSEVSTWFWPMGSGGGSPLSVSATASVSQVLIALGSAVTFTASASGGNSSSYSYVWTFSDGTQASGASVTKTPGAAGTYSATVTVTDGGQSTATNSASVTVQGTLPGYYTLSLPSGASSAINVPQGGSVQATFVVSSFNSYTGTPVFTAGSAPQGVTVTFMNGGVDMYGTVTATISASSAAALGPFPLEIVANDGSSQVSLTLNVMVTAAMPLSVTTSVIFSNVDPVAHTGRTATLVAYVTGGTGPFTYQWSGGGGGTWSGNRMAMTAPSAALTGTLTVTGNGQTVPVVVTIPAAPVVTEDALYAGVLDKIWAVENFADKLDSLATGGAYFHNLILSKANQQQPILTPAQYASLKTLANNYKAEQANDVASLGNHRISRHTLTANQIARTGNYLTQIQAQTGLGNADAPTGFDTYVWSNNYAPDVECEGGGGSGGDSIEIYLDNYLVQDPVSLKLYASANAWVGSGFEGSYDGTQVSLTLSLYDSDRDGDVDVASPVEYDNSGTSAWVTWQPNHPGDQYTSYAFATATAYIAEDDTENAYADSLVTLNTLSSCIPIPSVSGAIMVDGVPTNGFVLPPSGTKTGTLTISGECMAGVTGISFLGLSGLTATVTQNTTTSVTASYSLSSTATVGWGALQASTPTEPGGTSPAVVAPSLPYITSILPNPWQSGTTVGYIIYGAGFGSSPSVSITLANGGSVTASTSCSAGCSDWGIEGTVTLPTEGVQDLATVSVTSNGYGSGFLPQAPAQAQGTAQILPNDAVRACEPCITGLGISTSSPGGIDPDAAGVMTITGSGLAGGTVTISPPGGAAAWTCGQGSPCSAPTQTNYSEVVFQFNFHGVTIGSYGITVTTGAGVSNVWYFNVVPEIDFGGADITDLTGLSAVTGQQIALTTVAPLPSGVSISSQSWTVPGTTVGGFAATSYLLGVPLTGGPLPTDFSENSNTFYWVDAANARQVRYEVTLSDGQILDSYALFNVGGPVAPVVSVVSGSVVTDQNILVNPSTGQPYYDPSGTQVLVYEGVSKLPLAGNPTPTFPNPYTAGITISGSVTQPPGVAGKMVFVQLLDSYNVVLSAPGLQNGGCLFAGLDGGFPYGAVGPSSGPTTYMYDSPKVSLVAPTTYASAIFSAHAYVMWQPSLPSSIPVPLGYVRWGLSGYAENNGAAWVLDTSDPVNKPNAGYASDFQVGNTYPNWSSFVPPQPSCAKPN